MDIYLIRHAEAKPVGVDNIRSDADRPLTDLGEAQTKVLAAGLQKRKVHLDLVATSPLIRAVQTAQGMLRHWSSPPPELRMCDELAPGNTPKKLSRFLRRLSSEAIGLVGHMPDLGDYAAWLIGSKKAQIDLAKAGVALVRCPDGPRKGSGTLLWLVTPEWLTE